MGSRIFEVVGFVAALVVVLSIAGCSCGSVHERADSGIESDAGLSDAPSIDAGPDAPVDVGPRDAPPLCELSAPSSDLAGATPLGPIAFDFAWAGRGNLSKSCFGVALHATDTPSIFGPPTRSLWVWLPRESAAPIVGVHNDVFVTLEIDGAMATTNMGVVEVTAFTRDAVDPAVEATFTIVGDGFDVHGTISVPYCIVFADPCI